MITTRTESMMINEAHAQTGAEFILKHKLETLTPDGTKFRSVMHGDLLPTKPLPHFADGDILRIGFHIYEVRNNGELYKLTEGESKYE